MLLESMAVAADIGNGSMGIITNGSIKRRALMIASLTRAGMLYGSVSQDQYHDPISHEVVEAFNNLPDSTGSGFKQGVWDTSGDGTREPLPHGRAKELNGFELDEFDEDPRDDGDCPCTSWVVKPDGTIYQCGCEDAPVVGHVDTGIESPTGSDCYRSPWFVEQCCDADVEHLLYA